MHIAYKIDVSTRRLSQLIESLVDSIRGDCPPSSLAGVSFFGRSIRISRRIVRGYGRFE